MGNAGVYGTKRFENLDYAEGVASGEIATTAIGTDHLAAEAVTAAKIATTALTTALLKDENVTAAKIATTALTTALIKDENITTGKIATTAITTALLKDANVTAGKQAASGKRQTIVIQDGAGAIGAQFVMKRGQSFYLENAYVIGKNKAATSAATFTPVMYNGATAVALPSLATTVSGAVATASTAIGSTMSGEVYVQFPATTYFTDGRAVIIQGYNE